MSCGRLFSYLAHLHTTGEISEKAFESLVEYACELFVEAEVERRLGAYLEKKLFGLLDKLTSDDAVLKLLGMYQDDQE